MLLAQTFFPATRPVPSPPRWPYARSSALHYMAHGMGDSLGRAVPLHARTFPFRLSSAALYPDDRE
jgi:hypothetical protein